MVYNLHIKSVTDTILWCYCAGTQQPNIHPGSISSTGRQRAGPGPGTGTSAAQLIGGGISPTLFTSPVSRIFFNYTQCIKAVHQLWTLVPLIERGK